MSGLLTVLQMDDIALKGQVKKKLAYCCFQKQLFLSGHWVAKDKKERFTDMNTIYF